MLNLIDLILFRLRHFVDHSFDVFFINYSAVKCADTGNIGGNHSKSSDDARVREWQR